MGVESRQAPNANVEQRMREDWNRRAREDAHYYVAFGRHGQEAGEFFDTAGEIVYGLEFELKRVPKDWDPQTMRALEIGCGPGRLMKPLSRRFGEIHGVDVSDEMVQRARENLAGIAHAHVHLSPGADLRQFASESFDFVYSYAVFQHIPSKEVVASYLAEARRVLKTGGYLWFQVNGLPDPAVSTDTWSGVRYRHEELREFANRNDFQMYILEGVDTQYMWTSLRKRRPGWFTAPAPPPLETSARIKVITNPQNSEPFVPQKGRFACASLWVENLHPEAGLNHMRVNIGGLWAAPNYIEAPRPDGLQQINVLLPEGTPTGLVPVRIEWLGQWMCPEAILRVRPAGPVVPRLKTVSDATDMLSTRTIASGSVRVTFQELIDPFEAILLIDGRRMTDIVTHCADPRIPQHDVVFRLPENIPHGMHRLEVRVGKRQFPAVILEIAQGPKIQAPW